MSEFFDSEFSKSEQLPRQFTVLFEPVLVGGEEKVRVSVDGIQAGNLINDNSLIPDYYRYQDVFHYTYAAPY